MQIIIIQIPDMQEWKLNLSNLRILQLLMRLPRLFISWSHGEPFKLDFEVNLKLSDSSWTKCIYAGSSKHEMKLN